MSSDEDGVLASNAAAASDEQCLVEDPIKVAVATDSDENALDIVEQSKYFTPDMVRLIFFNVTESNCLIAMMMMINMCWSGKEAPPIGYIELA